jgi:hypothetical protein
LIRKDPVHRRPCHVERSETSRIVSVIVDAEMIRDSSLRSE